MLPTPSTTAPSRIPSAAGRIRAVRRCTRVLHPHIAARIAMRGLQAHLCEGGSDTGKSAMRAPRMRWLSPRKHASHLANPPPRTLATGCVERRLHNVLAKEGGGIGRLSDHGRCGWRAREGGLVFR